MNSSSSKAIEVRLLHTVGASVRVVGFAVDQCGGHGVKDGYNVQRVRGGLSEGET